MKPNTDTVLHHIEDGIGESFKSRLDMGSLPHLMEIMTDLYSDPLLAFIREYATNALDSHIEAHNPNPILVTLPTTFEPTFKVQDFGLGLDPNDLRDIYSVYGGSTKRESDEVTGTLGLGCKSGLTYTLSLTIMAVKHGLKTVAIYTKDDKGIPEIKVMDTSATDEPNGVTITIPIKTQDVESVREKAAAFFRYWRGGRVLIDGKEPEFYDHALFLTDDLAVMPQSHGMGGNKIVMGHIPYSFSGYHAYTTVAWVEMGAVNFPPSREALRFTDRTKLEVERINNLVASMLPTKVMEFVESAPTPYEQIAHAQRWGSVGVSALRKHTATAGEMDVPLFRDGWALSINAGKITGSKWPKVSLRSLVGDYPIVTGFPNMTVSRGNRQRLQEMGLFDLDVEGGRCWILVLPEGTDLYWLKGRTNVFTWQEVLDATPDPPRTKGNRSRSATVYRVRQGANSYQTTQLDNKELIFYTTVSQGWPYVADHFPEAHRVELYAHQVDRFLRLHPKAVRPQEHFSRVVQNCRKRLTEEDRLSFSVPRGYDNLYRLIDQFEDPDLHKVIRAGAKPKRSKWFKKLMALGADHLLEPDPLPGEVSDRYPLLDTAPPSAVDDVVIYCNAKFKTIQQEEVAS